MGARTRSVVIAVLAVGSVGLTAAPARAAYVLEVNPATWCTVFGASGATSHFNYSPSCNFNDYWGMSWAAGTVLNPGPPAPAQHQFLAYRFNAPSWLTLTSAITTTNGVTNVNTGGDWYGASYWNGGSHGWPNGGSGAVISDGGFGSSYWGFLLECETAPSCSTLASMQVGNVVLIGNESTAPSLAALGYGNLWYETSRYVWNLAGDPWPFPVSASDPSGVCNLSSAVNGVPITGPSYTPNLYVLLQCPNPTWNTTVDTRAYVPGSGSLSLQYHATNAAGNTSSPSETVAVDNDPVSISLSSPNDANPTTTWVNHAVNVTAFAAAGPSGVAGASCSQDGATPQTYPTGGLTIDGDGVHTVSCTAWNNAVDPQGAHNSTSASQTVHIDKAPPSIAFEPQNPGAPTQLVVDAADGESGVQSGSIAMARAGSSAWTTLPTGFDGQHVIAQVNDAGLHGTYTFRATSCDNAGNCATAQELLSLPLRTQAVAVVGFTRVQAPAKVVSERVRVGWRYKRIRRHGHVARIKSGGHMITVRLVIRRNAACTHRRVRTGPHRWRELTACRALRLVTDTRRRVPYGKPITIHGVLATRAGVPIADASLVIQTAPRNGLGRFHTVAVVKTAANGSWSLTLRAGPSRTIRALYFGSTTALPTSGQAITTVPARITIAIAPRTVSWGSTIRITGRVLGGYVPANSSLIRLNVGIGKIGQLVGLPTISPNGRFLIVWRFTAGQGVVHPWFSVGTLPESAFPYAPGTSARVIVTLR